MDKADSRWTLCLRSICVIPDAWAKEMLSPTMVGVCMCTDPGTICSGSVPWMNTHKAVHYPAWAMKDNSADETLEWC